MVLSLFALKPQEISDCLNLSEKYHGRQIYSWLCRGVTDFDKMTDLPLSLRKDLSSRLTEGNFNVISSSVIETQKDLQNNVKLALKLYDNSIIECVLLADSKHEYTACLSSQVGCAMGCKFCRTASMGLKRNLNPFEIIEQFVFLQRIVQQSEEKISHIVFMGMGEPLANFDNLLKSVNFLHDRDGIGISYRKITISTCGLANVIEKLSECKVPLRLAVSLVSAIDEKRSILMPVNKRFNLSSLKQSLLQFQKKNRRRFTLEYCMIYGQNISYEDASALANFCRNLQIIVNLIPFNSCPELEFQSPTSLQIKTFTSYLDKFKIPYTIRKSRGRSIRGACGQLVAEKKY